MTELHYPLRSLKEGHWFKLICGASFQHLPAIRSLVLAYALAGADCIDVAADPAVILTAKTALNVAARLVDSHRYQTSGNRVSPWLMVSFNDGEDPHFRKAEFNAALCPPDCLRPCEAICPAQAIASAGVIDERCYGCGRCLPVCPIQHIATRSYVTTPGAIAPLILSAGVDAIELHTQVGRLEDFRRLWQAIVPWIGNLQLVAVSCPDGEGLIDYLWALHEIMAPLPCALVWQTDGRPMSGDIGIGATRAAIKLGQKVLAANLPGYVQLAGGTNHRTVAKLKTLGLLNPNCHDSYSPTIAGVAYGSYARTLLAPILSQLEQLEMEAFMAQATQNFSSPLRSPSGHSTVMQAIAPPPKSPILHLEDVPDLLHQAVNLANSLVSQLKCPSNQP